MRHHGGRRLVGVPLSPVLGKESEPDVDVLQGVPLDQTADPDRDAVLLALGQVQAEAEPFVHGGRPLQDVGARVVERPHAPVADEPQEGGLVHQPEDEPSVLGRLRAQDQTLCFQDFRHFGSSTSRSVAAASIFFRL